MTLNETMTALEAEGTAQNRKVYTKHGAQEPMFGVSFATLGVLQKRIKVDHALALELWETCNHDARVLATMIADPSRLDDTLAEKLRTDLNSAPLADLVARLLARAPNPWRWIEPWTASPHDWTGQLGFDLIAHRALQDTECPDDWFLAQLARIETELHTRANRTRHAMNNALIAIGGRGGELQDAALAAADRIGKVVVDHGDTSCKTPDARGYILKMAERAVATGKKAGKSRRC